VGWRKPSETARSQELVRSLIFEGTKLANASLFGEKSNRSNNWTKLLKNWQKLWRHKLYHCYNYYVFAASKL